MTKSAVLSNESLDNAAIADIYQNILLKRNVKHEDSFVDREDLLQDAAIQLIESTRKNNNKSGNIGAYVTKIIHYITCNRIQRHEIEKRGLAKVQDVPAFRQRPPIPDPERYLEIKELHRFMETLPPRQKEVAQLLVGGYRLCDMQEMLGIHEKSLSKYLVIIRRKANQYINGKS